MQRSSKENTREQYSNHRRTRRHHSVVGLVDRPLAGKTPDAGFEIRDQSNRKVTLAFLVSILMGAPYLVVTVGK